MVWLCGALLAFAITSFFAARIANLNHTMATLDGDEEIVWTGTAPETPAEILSWANLSLYAIPICLTLYLTSLFCYFRYGRKGHAQNTSISTDDPES